MADSSLVAEWILLLMALYALGAGVGEMVRPGSWAAMLDDFAASPATAFLTGMVLIALGGAIYLTVPPWGAGDWLDMAVKALGGGMAIEGFAVLAAGQTFMTFARMVLGHSGRAWAAWSIIIGGALAGVAGNRLF